MAARHALKSFLAKARGALATGQPTRPLTFVVGNESADLDSLCSAVLLAYLRSSTPPHTLHIPLSNLPRADLGLRTEMGAVLRHAGLAPSDLLTLSELPDLAPEDTRWLLVDHNSLTGPLAKFKSRVVGCIDHHLDEEAVPMDAAPRVIEPCGSCASLIVHEMAEQWRAISGADSSEAARNLAKLALAPILVDTINMTATDKVREKDRAALGFLKDVYNDESLDTTAYFEEISKVKENISDLGFWDIFRKDYKEWDEAGIKLGICSVVQDLDYLIEKAEGSTDILLKELSRWAESRQVSVMAVMTTSNVGSFHRDLFVWVTRVNGLHVLERFMSNERNGNKLQLTPWNDGALDWDGKKGEKIRRAWKQGNLAGSRKQVAPVLREAIRQALGAKV